MFGTFELRSSQHLHSQKSRFLAARDCTVFLFHNYVRHPIAQNPIHNMSQRDLLRRIFRRSEFPWCFCVGSARIIPYPLVNLQKTHGKIHHAINGKIHYFYGHFQ